MVDSTSPPEPGKIASQPSEGRRALMRSIILFLILTAAFSSIFYAFIIATGHVGGGNGVYELGLMWSPAIAALLTCRVCGLPLQTLGWAWGAWHWQWLAFVIPLSYTAVAYALIWLFGYGGFPDPKFVISTRASLGWTGAPDWLVLAGYFLLIGSAGMALSMAFALGEEIGWRGFLAPRLTARFGFKAGAMLTGLVWTAWHLPLVFFWCGSPRLSSAGLFGLHHAIHGESHQPAVPCAVVRSIRRDLCDSSHLPALARDSDCPGTPYI